ncbi:hypothetical protein [Changpingibacter yushuensis]|uniref:hypothetical protein n=1 Tax=Changpingibacter yushuensis TaxID=2758440 RepID=UPI00165D8950|nr:hypothetical protein [Changpingibacter yushuensis]
MSEPGVKITLDDIWRQGQETKDEIAQLKTEMSALGGVPAKIAGLEARVAVLERRADVIDSRLDNDQTGRTSSRAWVGIAAQLGSIAIAGLSVILALIQTV